MKTIEVKPEDFKNMKFEVKIDVSGIEIPESCHCGCDCNLECEIHKD